MTKPTKWVCAQRRLRSAWAFAQSDQSSSLSTWRNLGSLASHWAHSEDWSDWVDAQADLSLRWVHIHFVGFVMSRLICHQQIGKGIALVTSHRQLPAVFSNTNLDNKCHTFEHFIWLQPSFFCIGDLQLGHGLELVTSHRQLAAVSHSCSVPSTGNKNNTLNL